MSPSPPRLFDSGTLSQDPGRLRLAMTLVAIALSLYLFWNTGIHSDDYWAMLAMRQGGSLGGSPVLLTAGAGLPTYLTFWQLYRLLPDSYLWVFDLVKWAANMLSVWLTARFAADYLPRERAWAAAIIFVFYPVHDATLYWYMTVPYILTAALVLYSHHLVRQGILGAGFGVGLLGSFLTYASPPYTFGLSLIFLWQKSYRKFLTFLLPGLLFVGYYFAMAALQLSRERQLDRALTIPIFLKNLLLQLVTFLDAAAGPSFWLKLWSASRSITAFSLLLAILICFLVVRLYSPRKATIPPALWWSLAAVVVLALGMLALTGKYSQIAFNLGNRVTVYWSLPAAFLLASLPSDRKSVTLMLSLAFAVPVLGLSDHWKSWNGEQRQVVNNVGSNPQLASLAKEDIVLVTGHLSSRLGSFAHVEFFSSPWVVGSVFKGAGVSALPVALPHHVSLAGVRLFDRKFGRIIELGDDLYHYDSDRNLVQRITLRDVPGIMARQPGETRHWVQLAARGPLQSVVLRLSPRLGYLFQ